MALDLSRIDLSALDAQPLAAPTLTAPKAALSKFEEDPNNPRFEFDDPNFDHLVEDIRVRGILQPVVVQPVDGGKLRIRFGARRYRAAERLKLSELPYVVAEDPRQFDDYAQVSENEQRKSLQPLELATFITKKLKQGESKKQIATNLQIDPSAITHLLGLIEPPKFILDMYHGGKCRTPQYLYELRRLHDKNPDLVERQCAQADEITRPFVDVLAQEIQPPITNRGSAGEETETGQASPNQPPQRKNKAPADKAKSAQANLTGDPKGHTAKHIKLEAPVIRGTCQGRDANLIYWRRPLDKNRIFVQYEDGEGVHEALASAFQLTELMEGRATEPTPIRPALSSPCYPTEANTDLN